MDIFIDGLKFTRVSQITDISVADIWVSDNKIGVGHGGGALYIGHESDEITQFFGDHETKWMISRSNLIEYLKDAEFEYRSPNQQYLSADDMSSRYAEYFLNVHELLTEDLIFKAERSDVTPPRYYVNSLSSAYDLLRKIALPKISKITLAKMISPSHARTYIYAEIRIDSELKTITQASTRTV